jgi:serine/threonine-protein kinase HipA
VSTINLFIHFNKIFVGVIDYNPDTDIYDLKYDKEWMKIGFEITPSLGFSQNFSTNTVKNFLENLLPEGEGLEELSQYLQISKSDKFSILQKIGFETAGALLFSHSKELDLTTSFREIKQDELESRITKREMEPISLWDGKLRLSVAGVQAKLPLLLLDDKIGFGEGDLCSTHIFKFDKGDEKIVLNEFISMKLSSALGFNTAEVEYLKIGQESVLSVLRFDRKFISNKYIERRHIIDSVQALGYRSSFKYERLFDKKLNKRDGVSFEKLFSLDRYATVPLLFRDSIVKFSMLNLILGNSDAHGKNISFFVSEKGLEIAPFYDLVNIDILSDKYEKDMAMAIDDEFLLYSLGVYDFNEFFKEHKIDKNSYFEEFKKLTINIKQVFDNTLFLHNDKVSSEEYKFINSYRKNLFKRVNFLSKVLNNTRFIVPLEDDLEEDRVIFVVDNLSLIKKVLAKEYSSSDNELQTLEKYLLKIKKRLIKKI